MERVGDGEAILANARLITVLIFFTLFLSCIPITPFNMDIQYNTERERERERVRVKKESKLCVFLKTLPCFASSL